MVPAGPVLLVLCVRAGYHGGIGTFPPNGLQTHGTAEHDLKQLVESAARAKDASLLETTSQACFCMRLVRWLGVPVLGGKERRHLCVWE